MATTKYIVNNITGQTINGESVQRPYKVYTALLTQTGDGTSTQTSGPLEIGKRYAITTYVAGDDFSNVGNVVSGVINTDGCEFIATGTTPTDYTNGSTLTDTAAPVAIILENTLGGTPVWGRTSQGRYTCTLAGAFPEGKTYCTSNNGFDWSIFGQINFGRGLTGNIDTLQMYYTDPAVGSWQGVDINCFPSYDVYVEIRVYP